MTSVEIRDELIVMVHLSSIIRMRWIVLMHAMTQRCAKAPM